MSLFEAANRSRTDLVILNGVKWLPSRGAFPFDCSTVEYGIHSTAFHRKLWNLHNSK